MRLAVRLVLIVPRAELVLLRRRLKRCGEVHRQFHPPGPRPLAAQRGDCDVGCDAPGDGCDVCDGCDGCDWPERKRKDQPSRKQQRPKPVARRYDSG